MSEYAEVERFASRLRMLKERAGHWDCRLAARSSGAGFGQLDGC
ncbi:hypothetical protein [Streptomyces sp. NPDC050121]